MRGPNRVGVEVAYGEIRHENTVGHPRGSQRTSIRPNLVAWAVACRGCISPSASRAAAQTVKLFFEEFVEERGRRQARLAACPEP